MRMTGNTVISRDSIVRPSMAGGPKREVKEGMLPRIHSEALLFVQSDGFSGQRSAIAT